MGGAHAPKIFEKSEFLWNRKTSVRILINGRVYHINHFFPYASDLISESYRQSVDSDKTYKISARCRQIKKNQNVVRFKFVFIHLSKKKVENSTSMIDQSPQTSQADEISSC